MDSDMALKTMKYQSHAVTAQRLEPADSADDFPTPPWATRALIEHVIGAQKVKHQTCLEPACGAGHMSKVLEEYFFEVSSADINVYGYGSVKDYLSSSYGENSFDWIITNPPFRLGEEFLLKALAEAKEGVAILARTVFIESVGRYNRIFRDIPLSKFAQFTERVPMVKGRLDKKATTATGYAWLVWEKQAGDIPQLVWIPPCRKALERDADYSAPVYGQPRASAKQQSSLSFS